MTPAEAIQIVIAAYPKGPEEVAVSLGAEVRRAPLKLDGWCLRGPKKTIITLNRDAPPTRQHFTLAHEVAHLIYGSKTDIIRQGFELYDAKSGPERQANALAAKLLLPVRHLQSHVSVPIVDPATIRKVSTEATVSERMVALRLSDLAGELGIGTAGVVAFGSDGIEWKKLNGLPLDDATASRFFDAARTATGRIHREHGRPGRVYVAAALHNAAFPTLFVQDLPYDQAITASKAERLRSAGKILFADEEPFRRSLEGKVGAFKPTVAGLTLNEAVEAFIEKYGENWQSAEYTEKFLSRECRRYIRLKLSQWFPD